MPITLPIINLAGASPGQLGSMSLAPTAGVAGVSYATFGHSTLRLHNESACGLQCVLPISGQQFYLPAGGWVDCFPQGGDDALNFTILYILTNPGVSLLLGTFYAQGETVPAMPILGNSPVGGGAVSSSFNQLVNTGNAPGTNIINAQPNDAVSPTWTADNSGNLLINSDNSGTLTTLLQLVAGASPAVKIAASNILTTVLGQLMVDKAASFGTSINGNIAMLVQTLATNQPAIVALARASQTANIFQVENSSFAVIFAVDVSGNAIHANNTGVLGTLAAGGTQALLVLNASNNTVIAAPSGQLIEFSIGGLSQQAQINSAGLEVANGAAFATNSSGSALNLITGATIGTSNSMETLTNVGAITGVILAQPTMTNGQIFACVNNGTGSITFAAAATSHVAGGAAIVIGAGNSALFVHSIVDSLWHRIVAN